MDYIWITARSLTQAQKMMGVLRSAGIAAVMERTRGAAAAKGCGYMVGVNRRQERRAKELLGAAGLWPGKAFQEKDGMLQEAEYDLF